MAERPSNTQSPGSDPGQGGTPRQPTGSARPVARPLDRPAGSALPTQHEGPPSGSQTGSQTGSQPASQMAEPKLPGGAAGRHPIVALIGMLDLEPAIGIAIVNGQGRTVSCNQRFTALTEPAAPDQGAGQPSATPPATPPAKPSNQPATPRKGVWARVGPDAVRTAATRRHAAVVHFIHEGRQVQCDVWPLSDGLGLGPSRDVAGESLFLVLAVEGRFEPAGPEGPGSAGSPHFTTLTHNMANLGVLAPLTARELEVLAFIGKGLATREIADALGRSPRTVERHCDAIHKKLGTSNRVQMARYAILAGLTPQAGKLKRV